MTYYTQEKLNKLGFKSIGKNVKISDKVSIYDCEQMTIGDNSRIDDFCVISGNIQIGSNVHITPMCLIAGGIKGVILEDFTTLAYGVKIFSQSDDYTGETMTNSLIPKKFKREIIEKVLVKQYSIIGSNSVVMPGVILETGTSVGAMSLILSSTSAWGIYYGIPATRIKDRSKKMLEMKIKYDREMK